MLLLLLVLGFGSPPHEPTFDVAAYRFAITVTDDHNRIKGHAEVIFAPHSQLWEPVVLDLVSSNGAMGMTVKQVRFAGHSVSYSHRENRLTIEPLLKRGEKPSDETVLEIDYEGVPADGLVIGTNRYKNRTIFADNWPNRAHHWIPCVDHPRDKARVEFIVTAPAHYQVIANGICIEQKDLPNGMRTTHYRTDKELPTKVMVIGIARFAIQEPGKAGDTPISSWVFPEEQEQGFKAFEKAIPVVIWMENYIGDFPYDKLANVQSKTRYGGMENAGAIFYYEKVFNSDSRQLLAHEIAHQWFGNAVSESDWPQIWLSEGFATYFAMRYMGAVEGEQHQAHLLKQMRAAVLSYAKAFPNKTVVREETDLNQYLGHYNYRKGAWILHMLQQRLGEENFRQGIRQFYQRYQHRNANSQQFQAIMEEVSGTHLNAFFQQWLHEPELPLLDISWRMLPDQKTEITLTQKTHHVFDASVDLIIEGEQKTTKYRFDFKNKNEVLELDLGWTPKNIHVEESGTLLFKDVTVNAPRG